MDDLKRQIQLELDPDLLDKKKEKKQQKGFSTSGLKIVNHIAENLIEILEVESNVEYTMEYLAFIRIFKVMGFTKKEEEITSAKILNGYHVIIDFDHKEVMVYDPETKFSPVGQAISTAKYENDNKEDTEDLYSAKNIKDWFNTTNKI